MMYCKITSPTKTEVFEDVRSITLPAYSGQMQVLPVHAEAFIILQKGNIFLRLSNREDKNIPVTSGGCYIKNDTITVIL